MSCLVNQNGNKDDYNDDNNDNSDGNKVTISNYNYNNDNGENPIYDNGIYNICSNNSDKSITIYLIESKHALALKKAIYLHNEQWTKTKTYKCMNLKT